MKEWEAFCYMLNDLNYVKNSTIIFVAEKRWQALHQRLFVQFLDKELVSLLVLEVVDKPSHNLGRAARLKSLKLSMALVLSVIWSIMRDNFHEELLVSLSVSHDLVIENGYACVWLRAYNFVLVCSALKPLTYAEQEVHSREHLLVGQEVQLAVAYLGHDIQTEVTLGLAY